MAMFVVLPVLIILAAVLVVGPALLPGLVPLAIALLVYRAVRHRRGGAVGHG